MPNEGGGLRVKSEVQARTMFKVFESLCVIVSVAGGQQHRVRKVVDAIASTQCGVFGMVQMVSQS